MGREQFTKESLKAQDGKKVPLTLNWGPVIGEATLKYDPETGDLKAQLSVTDPKATEFLNQDPSFIFKKES